MRIANATRVEIEPFLAREWTLETAARFGAQVTAAEWEWREFCLAAYDSDEMVGAAIFRVRGGVAHLKNIISMATRRHQGIGGALLDEFERRAREMGCHKLTLSTDYAERSLRFYRRHGFEVEAILRDDAFHVDRCQMVKYLLGSERRLPT